MAKKRIEAELTEFTRDPPTYFALGPVSTDYFTWEGTINGPDDSPYAGGEFRLYVSFPIDYPFKPPKILFRTRIYHPNINSDGVIGSEILQDGWGHQMNISKAMFSIQKLLRNPNPNDPLDKEIAEVYKTDPAKFDATAKEWTKLYASETS